MPGARPVPSPLVGRRRRRRSPIGWLLRLVFTVLVFAAGVALGQALEENPQPTGPRTAERTLRVATVAPPPVTRTVTVAPR